MKIENYHNRPRCIRDRNLFGILLNSECHNRGATIYLMDEPISHLRKIDYLIVFILSAATFPLFYLFIISLMVHSGRKEPNLLLALTCFALMVGALLKMIFVFKRVKSWIASVTWSLLSILSSSIVWLAILRICGAYNSL